MELGWKLYLFRAVSQDHKKGETKVKKTGLVVGLSEQRFLPALMPNTDSVPSQAILCGGGCTEPAVLSWHVNCL